MRGKCLKIPGLKYHFLAFFYNQCRMCALCLTWYLDLVNFTMLFEQECWDNRYVTELLTSRSDIQIRTGFSSQLYISVTCEELQAEKHGNTQKSHYAWLWIWNVYEMKSSNTDVLIFEVYLRNWHWIIVISIENRITFH